MLDIRHTNEIQNLDLAKPDGFLLALMRSRYAEQPAPLRNSEWDRVISTVYDLHPLIFDLRGRRRATNAVWTLLLELGDLETINGRAYHCVPKAWLGVFAEAFRRGLINRIVWGAAIRIVTTIRGGDDWPAWYVPDTLLTFMRQAAPIGMMTADELKLWKALPAVITIYRGGCVNAIYPADAVNELVLSPHWTADHEVAVHYMKGRCWQRRNDLSAGLPVIVKADVPRDAIFAYADRSGEQEVLVDFDRIDPATIVDLGAENYLSRSVQLAA